MKDVDMKNAFYATCLICLHVIQYWRWKVSRVSRYPTNSHRRHHVRQFCGNHPCLKISVIIPWETTMSHGNHRNVQKWTVLPRDTMCPAGICGIPWDTGNFPTANIVYLRRCSGQKVKTSESFLTRGPGLYVPTQQYHPCARHFILIA